MRELLLKHEDMACVNQTSLAWREEGKRDLRLHTNCSRARAGCSPKQT